ncbi:MAG: hypothetical protein OXP75_04950, partial [Rhodospirillales bacterium]|nr:hypothetical protein [Rhodospirillales bacterium]
EGGRNQGAGETSCFSRLRFTGMPNLGFGLSDRGARDWRVGWRLTSAVPRDPGFEVNLDATRKEPANDAAPEHGILLIGTLRW